LEVEIVVALCGSVWQMDILLREWF